MPLIPATVPMAWPVEFENDTAPPAETASVPIVFAFPSEMDEALETASPPVPPPTDSVFELSSATVPLPVFASSRLLTFPTVIDELPPLVPIVMLPVIPPD